MHIKRSGIVTALVFTSLLLIVIIGSRTLSGDIRPGASDIVAPALGGARAFSSWLGDLMPFAGLRDENGRLRDRLALIARQIEEIKVIYDENKRLRDLLAFKKNVPYTTEPAQVIGRDPTNWSNSLIIDKGLTRGVRKNHAVLSARGLVGRVVEAGRVSAKVLLITDPGSKVGVLVQRNRQGGVLVGRPDGTCKMIYISLDSDVAAGDKVITAGFGATFPKNIVVGEIVKVDKEPGRLYKYAIVTPTQDFSKLEEVLCIT